MSQASERKASLAIHAKDRRRYRRWIKTMRDRVADPAVLPFTKNGCLCRKTRKIAGYAEIELRGNANSITLVYQCSDLYVQGFKIKGNAYKFNDSTWNIAATAMGYGGSYLEMGWDRSASKHRIIDMAALMQAIDMLSFCTTVQKWKENMVHVRTVVIALAEATRMYAVEDAVLWGKDIPNLDWNHNNGKRLAIEKG